MTASSLFTTSADGTSIAYSVSGSGPAVVLVDGALCHRRMGHGAKLAEALGAYGYTVYAYDRRGRGESGPSVGADSVAREIEDFSAVIEAAGGEAHVFGASSGAALALEAARRGVLGIRSLSLYEAPFVVDDSRDPFPVDSADRIRAALDGGRPADALRIFLVEGVGMPSFVFTLMRLMPAWKTMKAGAETLPNDFAIMAGDQDGRPIDPARWAAVDVPTTVYAGAKSPDWMVSAQAAIAAAVPGATLETLPGQTHMIKPKVVAPLLAEALRGVRTAVAV